ncbi:MAG: hypothetical protein Q4D62_05520 [Planctomycetia bacterium]|nr:hypothetical protein [Planctomycetia bacterium]
MEQGEKNAILDDLFAGHFFGIFPYGRRGGAEKTSRRSDSLSNYNPGHPEGIHVPIAN